MRNKFVSNIIRFFLLVILQVVVFNNMQVGTYVNVFIYVAFILLLPFETPGGLLLLLALVMGLVNDIFGNTGGIHAAALVFMAFCRPGILKIVSPRDGYDLASSPTIASMGLGWFVTYSLILVFLHNFACFFLEAFRMSDFFFTLGKIILSTFVTVLLLITAQLITGKQGGNK
ncbi:MAG: rod shape-determining protein MreD [Bacteroidia bacterium]|nr:rod shape-determining protein MreD [Bacteroidia bacterium]